MQLMRIPSAFLLAIEHLQHAADMIPANGPPPGQAWWELSVNAYAQFFSRMSGLDSRGVVCRMEVHTAPGAVEGVASGNMMSDGYDEPLSAAQKIICAPSWPYGSARRRRGRATQFPHKDLCNQICELRAGLDMKNDRKCAKFILDPGAGRSPSRLLAVRPPD
ncbi:hypothetical protein FB451DRAFT_1167570 [Mycena latifolia]|nr:hypothetical protein FB451DRAFT_1167570 [Mycena latifolia]